MIIKIYIYFFIYLSFFHILQFNLLYANDFTISGAVSDSISGDYLVGANVYIENTAIGTSTDEKGSYSLTNINKGIYDITVSYIGYKKVSKKINLVNERFITMDFKLSQNTLVGSAVVVSAQAKGQIGAINKQLNSKSIKNIVSSDKLKELPDANAAEAIARLPGVSIQREGGEGNKVVIRGLSPKYNKVTINGVNVASTNEYNRSTDVSTISQYLVDGIEVTKAGTPDLDGDALGGTVNFSLKKAETGLQANILTQGIYNSLEKNYNNYKYLLTISNRFYKNKLGIIVQVDTESRSRDSHSLGGSYSNTPAFLDTINTLYLRSAYLNDIKRRNNRLNQSMSFDYSIPNGEITFFNMQNRLIKEEINFVENRTVGGNYVNHVTRSSDDEIEISTRALKLKKNLTPKLYVDMFLSSSNAKNNKVFYNSNFNEDYAFSDNILSGSLSTVFEKENDMNLVYYENTSKDEDFTYEKEITNGINIKYNFKINDNLNSQIKFGYKSREKNRNYNKNSTSIRWRDDSATDEPDQGTIDKAIAHFSWLNDWAIPGQDQVNYKAFMDLENDLSNFFDGDYDIGPAADVNKIKSLFKFFQTEHLTAADRPGIGNWVYNKNATNSLVQDYSGNEYYDAIYGMIDLNIGQKINVITGVRNEVNKTIYNSFHGIVGPRSNSYTAGADTVSSYTRTNSSLLPSTFIKYEPLEGLMLRYARTTTLTRPNYSDITPIRIYNGLSSTVFYNNFLLEPAISKNNDFVVSLYGQKLGLISFVYFNKNIEGLIFSSGRKFIINPELYGMPAYLDRQYINNYKLNNPFVVKLNGFEFEYQKRFWYLNNFLKGLILNFNYTRTFSEARYPRTIIDYIFIFEPTFQVELVNTETYYLDRLIDQPDQIMNFSLGYDFKGFSGRFSMLQISDVYKNTNFWPEMRETTDPFKRLDLSLKQKLPIDNLEIFLNIANLKEAVDISRKRGFNISDPTMNNEMHFDLISELDNNVNELLLSTPLESRAKVYEEHYGASIDIGFRYNFK